MNDSPEKAGPLGRFLDSQLAPEKLRFWRRLFWAALALPVLLSLVVKNHHPHFGLDAYPMFWPLFGLLAGIILIFAVKKILQPAIKRPEDHYGDL
jgi:hypothetical protein